MSCHLLIETFKMILMGWQEMAGELNELGIWLSNQSLRVQFSTTGPRRTANLCDLG